MFETRVCLRVGGKKHYGEMESWKHIYDRRECCTSKNCPAVTSNKLLNEAVGVEGPPAEDVSLFLLQETGIAHAFVKSVG